MNGCFDLAFTLYSDPPSSTVLKGPVINSAVTVTNGLFTTLVDFGPGVFVSGNNWLAISVSPSGANSFALLSPRQQVTPAPYALNGVGTVNTSQLNGTIPASSISGSLALAQLPAGVVTNTSPSLTIGGTNQVAPLTLRPTIPVASVGSVPTGIAPSSVAVSGRYAYVVNLGANTLQVLDVSNPTAPASVGSVSTDGGSHSVAVAGRYAYVANESGNTLRVFDVSKPTVPTSVGSVSTGGGPSSVAVGGRYAYVANINANTLQVFDVSNPSAPTSVGSVSTGVGPISVAVVGRYAYVPNYVANTLQVFDIGGAYVQELEAGALEVGTLQTRDTATIGNNLDVRGGLSVSGSARISGGLGVDSITASSFSGNGAGLTNILASSVTGLSSSATAPPGTVLIPAGSFTMGDSIGDIDIFGAAPVTATVSAFYMDINLISLSQWQTVYQWATLVGGYSFVNAGSGKAANHPVQTVDWYDCVKWCNARSEQAGLVPAYYTDAALTSVYRTGEPTVYVNWSVKGYRLPTEAEWEKAARGGLTGQRFPWGNTISQKQANYDSSPGGYDLGLGGYNAIGSVGGTSPATSPVGSFAPNGYGLYDMAGNVFEWVWDIWGIPYAGGTDPRGPNSGSDRVIRGGDWSVPASSARCASRLFSLSPTVAFNGTGFRAVLQPGR